MVYVSMIIMLLLLLLLLNPCKDAPIASVYVCISDMLFFGYHSFCGFVFPTKGLISVCAQHGTSSHYLITYQVGGVTHFSMLVCATSSVRVSVHLFVLLLVLALLVA